jgi:hypothetical protein
MNDRIGRLGAGVEAAEIVEVAALDATVIGDAFAQWIRQGETRSLDTIASDVLRELLNLTGAATSWPAAASLPSLSRDRAR